jgi:hypothetical protein
MQSVRPPGDTTTAALIGSLALLLAVGVAGEMRATELMVFDAGRVVVADVVLAHLPRPDTIFVAEDVGDHDRLRGLAAVELLQGSVGTDVMRAHSNPSDSPAFGSAHRGGAPTLPCTPIRRTMIA